MQSWGRWAAPPDCPCRKTTFSMLLTHSWEAALGPSCHILLCHRVLTPGVDAKGAGSVTAGHIKPLCCKVTVCQSCGHTNTVPCRQGPLFFPAEGWKYFWQSSNLKWFLLNAAPSWQFPP